MAYKRIVYLSGPYRADTDYQVNLHIAEFRKWAQIVLECGWAVIDPIAQTKWLDGCGVQPGQFIEADLTLIERLIPGRDVMLMLKGHGDSDGAWSERDNAEDFGIAIMYAASEAAVREWLLANQEWRESA